MKVTYAPIVSSASGRFGGTVATTWKGIGLFRRFAKPSNPNTADQQEVRTIFKTLTKAYITQTTELRAAWETYAAGKAFIGRNRWIGLNVPLLKGDVAGTDMAGTPGDASTLGPVSAVITPGVGELSCAIVEPTTPTGWTLTSMVAVCVLDKDWSTDISYADLKWTEITDESTPYVCILTGLTSSVLYQVRMFIKWLAPDGSTRYSVSLADEDTPTA